MGLIEKILFDVFYLVQCVHHECNRYALLKEVKIRMERNDASKK